MAAPTLRTPNPELLARVIACRFWDIVKIGKAANNGAAIGLDPSRAFAEGGEYAGLPGNGPKQKLAYFVCAAYPDTAILEALPAMEAEARVYYANPANRIRTPAARAPRAPRANPARVNPAMPNPAPVAPPMNPPVAAADFLNVNPIPGGVALPEANALAAALAAILSRGACDPEQVRAIVAEELAKVQPARYVLEVRTPDRAPVIVDEHTHPLFPTVLAYVAQGLNVLLKGPAGCGKTHMAAQIARAMGLEYGDISGSAGASESQLTGKLLPVGEAGRFEYVTSTFVRMYEGGGLFLFDELDAFDPNMLLVANTATSNGHFTVDNRRENPVARRHAATALMASANTFGTGPDAVYCGRFQLDESTLDRWLIVEMDYDTAYERTQGPAELVEWVWQVRERANAAKVRRAVSTRMIQKGAKCMAAGSTLADVKARLLCAWTRDERAKVGA